MLDRDMEALARFQSSTLGQTELTLHQLQNTVDDLTSLAQTREGVHQMRLQRQVIKDSLIKLHDLFLDLQAIQQAAE